MLFFYATPIRREVGYGVETIDHIFIFAGNIWAQDWKNIESFSKPYPDKPEVDITAALVAQVISIIICNSYLT